MRDRSNGYNPGGVDSVERPVVVCFDVLEISRILERGVGPIQFFHPAFKRKCGKCQSTNYDTGNDKRMDSGISVPNSTQVALEMTDVYGVEANLLVDSAAHISSNTESLIARPTMVTHSLTSASVKTSPTR